MSSPSSPRLSRVTSLAVVRTTRSPVRNWIRSVLCTPRSAMAPMAAFFLSKNHTFFPGCMAQVSGPPWPKVVR